MLLVLIAVFPWKKNGRKNDDYLIWQQKETEGSGSVSTSIPAFLKKMMDPELGSGCQKVTYPTVRIQDPGHYRYSLRYIK